MRSRRLIGLLVLGLVVVATTAGCGDDDDTSSTTTTKPYDLPCTVAAQVAPLLIEALVKGANLPNGIDGPFKQACQMLLTSWRGGGDQFAFDIQGNGQTRTLDLTRDQLTTSWEQALMAPAPSCDDWQTFEAQSLCRAGWVGPPG